VPDEWKRQETARQNIPNITTVVCTVLVVALIATSAVIGILHWSRKRPFSQRTFVAIFATLLIVNGLNTLNSWPVIAANASTTQPLELQLAIAIATSLIFSIFSAAAMGLVAGLIAGTLGTREQSPRSLLIGISVGLIVAGAAAFAHRVTTPMTPSWGSLGPLSMFLPLLGIALSPIAAYITQTLVFLAIIYLLLRWPDAVWVWIVAGLAITGTAGIETMTSWLLLGVTAGVVLMIAYMAVFRHQPALLIASVATIAVLSALRDGLQRPFPGAIAGSVVAMAFVALTAAVWYKGYRKAL
jgi:hypothetical protein